MAPPAKSNRSRSRDASAGRAPDPEDSAVRVAELEAQLAAVRRELRVDAVATHAHVASTSSSTTSKEGATATRRWTSGETRARLVHAPTFAEEWVDEGLLSRLCEEYEQTTGDPVLTRSKRNFLAATYRRHGSDFMPFVCDVFEATGTATNLLGVIRTSPQRTSEAAAFPAVEADVALHGALITTDDWPPLTAAGIQRLDVTLDSSVDPWESVPSDPPAPRVVGVPIQAVGVDDLWSCYPGLLYGPMGRPTFDPSSKIRWDDRSSNPDREELRARRESLRIKHGPDQQRVRR